MMTFSIALPANATTPEAKGNPGMAAMASINLIKTSFDQPLKNPDMVPTNIPVVTE